MTGNKKNPTGDLRLTIGDALHIEINDGLNVSDFESYARQLPNNSSEGETSRKFHSQDFAKMLKERDDYVADLLEGYLPEKVDGLVDGLVDLLVSTKPFTVGYYAVKYMLHRKLADCFLEQGQDLSAYREIYLLGATWAEAKFMTNYRDHARHGRKFRGRKPKKASRQRVRDGATTAEKLINAALEEIKKGNGLKKNGSVNVSKLARLCCGVVKGPGPSRVRHILGEAKKFGKLANRPLK